MRDAHESDVGAGGFPSWLRRERHGQGDERGAVAVEAAFIFPIFILILFGIIEFSLFLRDHVALSAAVRSGARTASAEPRMETFATDAAAAVLRAGTGMPFSSVDEMWIYEASPAGYPANVGPGQLPRNSNANTFTTCTSNCLVFTYSDSSFTQTGGEWDELEINACPGDVDMSNVGIYIRANHRFVSGIFGTSVTITDHAVLRFEPIPASQLLQSGQCKP